ncbi:hypothetical protein D9619_006530 [Psilocybe cf. subviscida]|uniref:Protein kinase domain-containing protein n=1 Tax=Psilocybe cf. subviscida TaxID=2480587 RepID=A0A8H5EXI1_9AGAR|nr:hypothetical protein D9619_006530 [Psilocybe cf. subviscida]
MPLPTNHLDQMFLQLISGVQALHKEFLVHSDLSPDNIELLDAFITTRRDYDPETGEFADKIVLSCIKIRLAYYGDLGLRSLVPGTDEYRAPEAVFNRRATYAADNFALGCVMGEIALGTPIFPPCEPGPLYEREKALLFNAISGPFSQQTAAQIESVFPRIFDEVSVKPICYNGISEEIRFSLKKAVPVRYMFDNMDMAEIMEGLICTDPENRSALEDILCCDYFRLYP